MRNFACTLHHAFATYMRYIFHDTLPRVFLLRTIYDMRISLDQKTMFPFISLSPVSPPLICGKIDCKIYWQINTFSTISFHRCNRHLSVANLHIVAMDTISFDIYPGYFSPCSDFLQL